jgi:RNA polymerase sigma-70 factor (ECF subfamily)
VLREYEGLSYPEIAEITGESITNIKVRIHRAKLKVREMVLSLELDSVKVVKEDIVLKDGL